jgi:hypothetical protein
MENMRKIFKDFMYGVKLGIKLSLLPKSVSIFHNHPLTRIFRVLGGISILLILTKVDIINKPYVYKIVFALAFLQFIYIIIISIIKFCYYIYLLKNKKLQVRNSPLNRIATFGLNLVACVKGSCQYGITAGAALGLGISIDELLIHNGRDPIFRSTLGKGLDQALNSIGYENPNKDITNIKDNIKTLKYRYKELGALHKDLDELNSIGEESGVKDSELVREIREDIQRKIEAEKASILQSRSKILSELDQKNIFKRK